MKLRIGFVSNSSSSSYILGKGFTNKEVADAWNKLYGDVVYIDNPREVSSILDDELMMLPNNDIVIGGSGDDYETCLGIVVGEPDEKGFGKDVVDATKRFPTELYKLLGLRATEEELRLLPYGW